MNQMNSELISYLFKTRAIRVCPRGNPFWYTSGKIGPYYVNTHFLFGSEGQANAFLEQIDDLKADKESCSETFHKTVLDQYRDNPLYRGTMDTMITYIREHLNPPGIDFVSGGERRDWFFSLLAAHQLKKPHITLFKDGDAVIHEDGTSHVPGNLKGARVLHIADLITSASSYQRAWVPIIEKLGAQMKQSLVVIDRLQGGAEVLQKLQVESHALVRIDASVFEEAFRKHYIDEDQLRMVLDYMEDPEGAMRLFLKAHPNFLSDALSRGGKSAQRAKLLIENNYYDLKVE